MYRCIPSCTAHKHPARSTRAFHPGACQCNVQRLGAAGKCGGELAFWEHMYPADGVGQARELCLGRGEWRVVPK